MAATAASNRSASMSISGTSLQARLHNFVKYALLQQLVPPGATVCDLYCGRGLDTEKWMHAQIGRYIGIDFSDSTLEEAREQWNSCNRPYPADFYEADPSMANLELELRQTGLPADFVTCMGHLQDCFSEEGIVRSLLHNVASMLKPGGYFFGITADSSTIWSKYQKVVESAHRAGSMPVLPRVNSEHYVISFEDDRFTPFGTSYMLQFADGVVSERQQLIHFPSLIRLAEEVGLEYIELQNLQEFYDDYRIQFSDILRTTCANLVDAKGKLPQFAHDILSLYTTFIFRKTDERDLDVEFSPWALADENQLEMYPEDVFADGNMVSYADTCSQGAGEHVHMRVTAEFSIPNDTKESHDLRSEDYKNFSSSACVDGNPYYSHPMEDCKDGGQVLHSSYSPKQLEKSDKQITEIDAIRSANIDITEETQVLDQQHESDELMEMEISDSPGPCAVERSYQQSFEVQQNIELQPQMEETLSADVENIACEVTLSTPAGDEAGILQNIEIGDGPPTDLSKAGVGEIMKEKKVESMLEEQSSLTTAVLKNENVSGANDSCQKFPVLSSPPLNNTISIERELEQKRNDLQLSGTEDLKNEANSKDSHKYSTGKTEVCGKEESSGGSNTKRSSAGAQPAASEQQRYRGTQSLTKAHHHHSSYSEEFSQGSRYKSNTSNPKISRERVGDHISMSQRGDSHRSRPRAVHTPPGFVPLIHFVHPPEFPVFQSPNTPGILGPGPAALRLPDPITFWPIPPPPPPPPIERRGPPKSRSSRKHGTERESSRVRKESPKKNWKDSPPPGTEN